MDKEYTSLQELEHIDPLKLPPMDLSFLHLNQPLMLRVPLEERYTMPYLQIKERIRTDDDRTVSEHVVISFIDENDAVMETEYYLNVFAMDFESISHKNSQLNWAFSSPITVFEGDLVQHFQVVNRINTEGKCWFIIQEFMYNIQGHPNLKLVALKLVLTDIEYEGQKLYFAPLYERGHTNSYIEGTQIFQKEPKEISTAMKNLHSHEYQIRNEISSNSYKFYSEDKNGLLPAQPKYLVVECRISDALKDNICWEEQYKDQNTKLNQKEVF